MTWKTFLAALAIFLAGGVAGAGFYAAFGPDDTGTTTVEAGGTTTSSSTTAAAGATTTAVATTLAPAPTTTAGATTYVIQRGDSLGKIAAQFGLTVAELAQANGITDPNKVQAGQVLQIPAPGTVVVTTTAAVATTTG